MLLTTKSSDRESAAMNNQPELSSSCVYVPLPGDVTVPELVIVSMAETAESAKAACWPWPWVRGCR